MIATLTRRPSDALSRARDLHPDDVAAQITYMRSVSETVATGDPREVRARYRELTGVRLPMGFEPDAIRTPDGYVYQYRITKED